MPLPPPLLVSPVDHLTAEDRAKFQDNVTEIARAKPGDVITCTFPVAMYHPSTASGSRCRTSVRFTHRRLAPKP